MVAARSDMPRSDAPASESSAPPASEHGSELERAQACSRPGTGVCAAYCQQHPVCDWTPPHGCPGGARGNVERRGYGQVTWRERSPGVALLLLLASGCVHGTVHQGGPSTAGCREPLAEACLCGTVKDIHGARLSGVVVVAYTAEERRMCCRDEIAVSTVHPYPDRLWDSSGLGHYSTSDEAGEFCIGVAASRAYLVHALGPRHVGVAGVVLSAQHSVDIAMVDR